MKPLKSFIIYNVHALVIELIIITFSLSLSHSLTHSLTHSLVLQKITKKTKNGEQWVHRLLPTVVTSSRWWIVLLIVGEPRKIMSNYAPFAHRHCWIHSAVIQTERERSAQLESNRWTGFSIDPNRMANRILPINGRLLDEAFFC